MEKKKGSLAEKMVFLFNSILFKLVCCQELPGHKTNGLSPLEGFYCNCPQETESPKIKKKAGFFASSNTFLSFISSITLIQLQRLPKAMSIIPIVSPPKVGLSFTALVEHFFHPLKCFFHSHKVWLLCLIILISCFSQ